MQVQALAERLDMVLNRGQGDKAGTAYRLKNGTMVYVPETGNSK